MQRVRTPGEASPGYGGAGGGGERQLCREGDTAVRHRERQGRHSRVFQCLGQLS